VRNLPGMASGESKSSGFTVTDRRSFSDSGDSRPEPTAEASPADQAAPDLERSGEAPAPGGPLPAVDFHTFILSLGSSALLHLGELEHPDAGGPRKDLPLAKHTIDILEMLEQKTKGNLTPAEDKLISSLLYDLRLRYVEASKA
jgi:hypothetical protein